MDEIEKLEIKVSYLEKENDELKEVVLEQGKSITHLEIVFEELKNKVRDLIEESGEERESRKPPHY